MSFTRRFAIAAAMIAVILALGVYSVQLVLSGRTHAPAAADDVRLPEADMHRINARPLALPLAEPRIVIDKSQRQLMLFDGERVARIYPAAMGRRADRGDKLREGDRRTPEGDYTICVKNPESRYYLSLGISYPNKADAARGLAEGVIDRPTHDRIVHAIDRGLRPPWDTPMGGEIFIHGHGSRRDWTLGCIALEDPHMEELYNAVPYDTPVIIRP